MNSYNSIIFTEGRNVAVRVTSSPPPLGGI